MTYAKAWQDLDQEKLTPLLKLKYHDAIADAVLDLGRPEDIGKLFVGFQKYLYQPNQPTA
jgi:type I restriction enzyme R subunit